MRHLLLPSLLTLLACDPKDTETDETDTTDTTDTDTDTDTGEPDTDTDTDTGEPVPAAWVGDVHGTLIARVGDERIRLRGASVYLAGDTDTEPVASDLWGGFRIPRGTEDQKTLCVSLEGLEADVCVAAATDADGDIFLGEVEVDVPLPAAWGRVSTADGRACVHRYPDFGVSVDTEVSAGDHTVLANVAGEYVLPGHTGSVSATCEDATATADAGGEKRTDLTFTEKAKAHGPIQLTGRGEYSVNRPPPGAALTAIMEVEDGAEVRWRSEGLEAEGTKVAWTVPSHPGEARLWALVSDGAGNYEQTSARILVGESMAWLGVLTDEEGTPIEGATIDVNGEQVETDAEGLYDLELEKPADRYLLTVRHPDYVPCRVLQHDGWRGSLPEAVDLDGTPCLRAMSTKTFDASSGTSISVGDTKVTVSGGILIDAFGKQVSGDVEVAWYLAEPGEPLAAEPVMTDKEGAPVYAETLGGMHIEFRSPVDPTERYTAVKPISVAQAIPKGVKDSDELVIASVDEGTGRLVTEEVSIEHGRDTWHYSTTLPTSGTFVPAVPIWDTGCIRVNVPEARFPGTLAVTASVPGTQASQPHLITRPVNSNLVVFGGLPLQETVNLYLFHVHPTQGQLMEASTSVYVTAKVAALSAIDAFPFDPVCADVTLPEAQPAGSFLTRHLVEPVTHYKSLLLTPAQVGNLYYNAIDPLSEKTTLSDWLDSLDWSKTDPRDLGGDEAFAIYGNAGDLGFGREMHMQIQDDPDGDGAATEPPVVAMYTTNYANVHHAALGNSVVATVAMEYAPHPTTGGSYYTKFFVFDAAGDRISTIPLDDNGPKAVPDLCVNCHGGAPADESAFYTVDQNTNTVSLMHPYPNEGRLGDTARFIPFAVETFDYSPLFSLSAQEEDFRLLNEALLKTNITDDARALVHGWYDDEADYALDTLGSVGDTQDTTWQPTGQAAVGGDWSGHSALYEEVYQPYCRSCHMSFDYVDFIDSSTFFAYSGLLESYLCTEPTMMPQAQVTQRNLFHDGDALQTLIDEMTANTSSWSATHCPQ